jgi:GT2 family glycosyltransferase
MPPELSVVIVNYNGLIYLKECFDALFQNLKNIEFEIIVIDNNSQDGSCAYLKANYPEIILIESNVNLGFGKGNNEAVRKAKGNYLLLLNNDTIVLDPLLPVLNFLKSDAKIGVVGIKMLDGNKKYLASAGNFPNYKNLFQMKKLMKIGSEFRTGIFTKEVYEVDWLSGSFLMLPTHVFKEIDGFDEDYFLYVEDVDFSKKIADKGYKRVFLSNYSYIHFVGFNSSKNHLLVKGYEIYIAKHFKGFNKKTLEFILSVNKLVKRIKQFLKRN